MRTYPEAVARAQYLMKNPSANVLAGGRCQAVARDIVGAAAWAPSALDAWNKIPAAHQHPLSAARPGMLGYAAYRDSSGRPQEFGHAFVIAQNGNVYTTDNPKHGRLNYSPITNITGPSGWHMPMLGVTDWTPSGMIALAPIVVPPKPTPGPVAPTVDLSLLISAALHDPKAPQGHKTYAAGTLVVEKALVAEGLLSGKFDDGSYGTLTIAAYAKWQQKLGYKGTAADGIPGMVSLTALGKKHGFKVVA